LRHLLFELALVEVGVVQLGTQRFQQTVVNAPLHAGERVCVPRRAARNACGRR
jgi:hypothetical protein